MKRYMMLVAVCAVLCMAPGPCAVDSASQKLGENAAKEAAKAVADATQKLNEATANAMKVIKEVTDNAGKSLVDASRGAGAEAAEKMRLSILDSTAKLQAATKEAGVALDKATANIAAAAKIVGADATANIKEMVVTALGIVAGIIGTIYGGVKRSQANASDQKAQDMAHVAAVLDHQIADHESGPAIRRAVNAQMVVAGPRLMAAYKTASLHKG